MRRCLLTLIAMLALAAPVMAQTPAPRVLYQTTMDVGMMTASANGQWVVFVRRSGPTNARLYIARTGGRDERPLTTEGYDDRSPTFHGNDKIYFQSNRWDRSGKGAFFASVLRIDPATGKPMGAPQQISTEPVDASGRVSPDGKWLTYVLLNGKTRKLQLISANGGSPRTLYTSTAQLVNNIVFSPDGKWVFFSERTPDGTTTVKRVSTIEGDKAAILAQANHTIAVLPGDPRYIIHIRTPRAGLSSKTYVDLTRDGKRVARLTPPRRIRWNNFSDDGLSLLGVANRGTFSTRVVSTDGRQTKVLTSGDSRFVEGWSPDSKQVLLDWQDDNRIYVQYMPIQGGRPRKIALPIDASVHGWAGTLGPYVSYWTSSTDTAGIPALFRDFYALDTRTGKSQLITHWPADTAYGLNAWNGRGGYEYDGDSFIYHTLQNGAATIYRKNPATGVASAVRTFRIDEIKTRQGIQVAGSRLAWQESTGDSIVVWMTNDAKSPPKRLVAFANRAGDQIDPFVTWSNAGDQIAIAHEIKSTGGKPAVTVISLDRDGNQTARTDLATRTSGVCWGLLWSRDDKSLFMQCTEKDKPNIMVLPLDARDPVSLTRDEIRTTYNYLPSPDGKWVAYSADEPGQATLYRLDLRALLKP